MQTEDFKWSAFEIPDLPLRFQVSPPCGDFDTEQFPEMIFLAGRGKVAAPS